MLCRCIVILLFAGLSLEAQETSGRVRGRVVRSVGDPPAVTVTLTSEAMQGARTVHADPNGYFMGGAFPPGTYTARVRAIGFREVIIERIAIALGETANLGDIALAPAKTVLDPVTVRHNAAAIDPVSTTAGSAMDMRVADRLPTGRNYESVLLLFPHVHPSSNDRLGLQIAGTTGLENAYYIDGINVTENYRHGGGITLPHSFMDQVELKTGGYDAEFGRAQGGIVSVTTRTGSNTPSVSAFTYYTASSLASTSSRSAFDLSTGKFARYDAGVSVSGPIVRNRLWYFAAYDAAAGREDLKLPGGSQTDRTTAHHFAGKLTWRPDSLTSVSATFLGDPRKRDLVGNAFWGLLSIKSLANPEPFLGYWNQSGLAGSVSASRTIGTILLESNIARSEFRDQTGPRDPQGGIEPLTVDFLTGEWSGGHGNRWDRRGWRNAASFSAFTARGPHTAKIGIQLEENHQDENWQWPGNGPEGAGTIFRVGSLDYLALVLDLDTRTRVRNPTLFGQTSILAAERVRLNLGLRWDGQYFYSPVTGFTGSLSQWQPRVGAIVYPTRSPNQQFTASAGRFYEQLPNEPITWFWGGFTQRFIAYPGQDPRVDPSGGFASNSEYLPLADLRGQHYDELTLGYQTALPGSVQLRIQGMHRKWREILQEATDPEDNEREYLVNPGVGRFDALPRPNSKYSAVELSLLKLQSSGPSWMLSYVLSRKHGNYVGVFAGNPNAHAVGTEDSTGLLPNDRRHVLKGFASTQVGSLNLGGVFFVQSGTPLTDMGQVGADNVDTYFLSRRGAAGRTPTIWNLDLRGTYDFKKAGRYGARVVADVLHVFSRRKPLLLNEVKFLSIDEAGKPATPNPFYGTGLIFQPPMTLRIGMELGSHSRGGR